MTAVISRSSDTDNAVLRAPATSTEAQNAALHRKTRQIPFAGFNTEIEGAVDINATQLVDAAKGMLNALNQLDLEVKV